MIGLVLVSHSRRVAESLVSLVRQVATNDVPLAIAAGVGPDRSEFGTDALEIMDAIKQVDRGDGVLVLMDLGSAVLSAQMALELLPEETGRQVLLCPAPLVEGAIAAGVQAGLGSSLADVCAEARRALQPKLEHLDYPPEAVSVVTLPPAEEAHQLELTLHNEHGLHARPAARFVQTAAQFESEIQVRNLTTGKGPVSGKSLNALTTLGAVEDHRIAISAWGVDAAEALNALRELVADNFGEHPSAAPTRPQAIAPLTEVPEGAIACLPIAEGVAVGPLFHYQPPAPHIPDEKTSDPAAEWQRLQDALDQVALVIQKRRDALAARLGEDEAAIFDAHLLILRDPELLDAVRQRIFTAHLNAAAAWHTCITSVAQRYRNLADEYLQQRAADVLDVGNQVVLHLSGATVEPLRFPHPVILMAEDLTPTETAQLDLSQVLGLITLVGGPTSHTAILARSLGIPAVTGVPATLRLVADETPVAIDGFEGLLWVEPTPDLAASLQARREAWLSERQALLRMSHRRAVTTDGREIEVVANVGKVEDAEVAAQNGAEGVGLLRTEFLFLTRRTPPGEDEQLAALLQVGRSLPGLPIIVRTLDVGGDKPLPYVDQPLEANPFLGVRAIRLSFQQPELFRTQLRAILRAAAEINLRVMFPMIATVDEVRRAKSLLAQVHETLSRENVPHRWPLETGIMVEIPSAALLADKFAPEVDFFSVGTNDLTQYTMAAERGNAHLFHLADALHPAVLKLIRQVVAAAESHGKWVGVCGELAGDPLAAPILIGLGVKELSLNPTGIPRLKSAIRQLSYDQAKDLAARVLRESDAATVRRLAQEFVGL